MSFDLNPALFTYPELNASRLDLEPESEGLNLGGLKS